MTPRPERPFLVLDLTLAAKLRGLAVCGTAGSAAAVVTNGAMKAVIGVLSLPFAEAAAAVIATVAFAEMTDYATERLRERTRPQDLALREMKPPRFEI